MRRLRLGMLLALFQFTVTAASVPPHPETVTFERLLILPDVSGSLDRTEFTTLCQQFWEGLPKIVFWLGVRQVDVLPWAGSASCWLSARVSVTLPERTVVDCRPPTRTDADLLFRQNWTHKKTAADEVCQQRQATADSLFLCTVSDRLTPVRTLLRALPGQESRSTALPEILARCSASGSHTLAIVITDAQSFRAGSNAAAPLPEGARTVVLIVPEKSDTLDVGRTLKDRRARLVAQAPWATTLFRFEVTGGPERWLLPMLQQNRREGVN